VVKFAALVCEGLVMQLDAFDRQILNIVQKDARLPNREISDRVNLSETAVRRRLARMREAGVITGDVTLVDHDLLGQTLIVSVTFKDECPRAYQSFRNQMQADRCVSQCYSVAAPADYVLIVHAQSLSAYENWAEKAIQENQDVLRYETTVAFTTVKFSTHVDLD
jgi:Lrp/AsnC family leucine-responsive transcriptional regulator